MCEPQHFDFTDLNLDFLDVTPPAPTQGAPNVTKCLFSPIKKELKPIINNDDQPAVGYSKNKKLHDLAKRIASTDLCVQQIHALEEERNTLQKQLQELQNSANDVRRLYDEEIQARKRFKCLNEQLTSKCDSLQKELTNKTLSCEQLESQIDYIKRMPMEYNDLVVSFLKISSSYDEEVRPLYKPQLELIEKLRKYCKENSLKTPEMIKRSPKKRMRKPAKVETGIQCELWKMSPIPPTAIAVAQVPKEMRSQGTQHISTTTTRSTCTSTFIKKHSVGTSFPEVSQLPPLNDIVCEILKWNIRPLSPIRDFVPAARSENEKPKRTTGTCTKLCNIQRCIDYVCVGQSLLSSIKRSNSRPPSRNMFDGFKHESSTPPPESAPLNSYAANNFPQINSMNSALSATTFEDLWQVFGQMLFGLLGNRSESWTSTPRSGNAQSQQEFYHWLRSLYADISGPQQQQQQQPNQEQETHQPRHPTTVNSLDSSLPNEGFNFIPQNFGNSHLMFLDRNNLPTTPNQGNIDNSQHTSTATSPIRPNSPTPGNICKIIIPSQAQIETQTSYQPAALTTDELQAPNELNENKKTLDRQNIVNEILKLFPNTESTQETRKLLNKMLKTKRHRKQKCQKANKNPKVCHAEEIINENIEPAMKQTQPNETSSEITESSETFKDNNIECRPAYVKLEDCQNSPLESDQREVPSSLLNMQTENLDEDLKETSLTSTDENELLHHETKNDWSDNEKINSLADEESMSCTEDDFEEVYTKTSFASTVEVSENQEYEEWNENNNVKPILQSLEESLNQTEDDKKDDSEESSFVSDANEEVIQNQKSDDQHEIPRSKQNSVEQKKEDIQNNYKETSVIQSAKCESFHNRENIFNSENRDSSVDPDVEEEIIQQSTKDLKVINGDIDVMSPTIYHNNQSKDAYGLVENDKASGLSRRKDENTVQMKNYPAEALVEKSPGSTPLEGESKGIKTGDLEAENDLFTENAVDFLAQLSSYSLEKNETITNFCNELPQSPRDDIVTSREYWFNENNFSPQSSTKLTTPSLENWNDNYKTSEATDSLMNTLFGDISDTDSNDDEIESKFIAGTYESRAQNAQPNHSPISTNSFTYDHKNHKKVIASQWKEKSTLREGVLRNYKILNEQDTSVAWTHMETNVEELPSLEPTSIQNSISTNSDIRKSIIKEEAYKNEKILNEQDTSEARTHLKTNVEELPCLEPTIIQEFTSTNPELNQPQNIHRACIFENTQPEQDDSENYHVDEDHIDIEEKNLVIDEDYHISSADFVQQNDVIFDEIQNAKETEQKAANRTYSRRNETPNKSNRFLCKSPEMDIEEIRNVTETTPTRTFSITNQQTSAEKEIRINMINNENTSVASTTNSVASTTTSSSYNDNDDDDDDDQFNNYLSNILNNVAHPSVSPISTLSYSISVDSPLKTTTQQTEPKKRGRKRKISVSPNSAPTAAIACKRSERLRCKRRIEETTGDTMCETFHAMTTRKVSDNTNKRVTGDHENPYESIDIRPNTIANDEETLATNMNLSYFRERSAGMCDSADKKIATQQTSFLMNPSSTQSGYQDIFQSFADPHRKFLEKKQSIKTRAEIPPIIKQETNNEVDQSNADLNCDIAKDDKEFDSPKSPIQQTVQALLDTSVDLGSLSSPASPPALDSCETFYTHSVTLDIPLEPDPTRFDIQKQSLLQRLISNQSSNLHRLVSDNIDKKCKNGTQAQLYPRIKEFLADSSDTNVEPIANQLVQDLLGITLNVKHISAIIVAEMQQVPRPEVELDCSLACVPAKYLGKQHRRISFVMRRLQELKPDFIHELIAHIESTLFKYSASDLSLEATLNITQLYLLTLSIYMPDMKKNPARLFIAKCLYYYNLKAMPMIYEVLCCFPTSLPHREERSYDRADPLITVIQHLLMSKKYDMDKTDLRPKELLSKLRFEYHYEPFKPDRFDVLTNLVEKIRADKLENIPYALALFCKRLNQPTVEKEVLENKLMPMANEFYQVVTYSDSNDARIACLLECISMVIKPFRMDTNITVYMSLFSRFLNVTTRATPQEAAVRAIIRCQRFGFVACYNELLNFKPNYELQSITKAMLQTFVYRKSAKFWRSLNTTGV